MEALACLRYVTAHYFELQGLRLVPGGLILLAYGLARHAGVLEAPVGRAVMVSEFAVLTATLVTAIVVGRWYHRRYGIVDPGEAALEIGRFTLRAWLTVPACFVVLATSRFTPQTPGAIAFIAFVLTAVCIFTAFQSGGVRRHYIPIAACCLLLGASELLGLSRTGTDGSLLVLAGIAAIVAGVGDHLILIDALHSMADEDRVGAI